MKKFLKVIFKKLKQIEFQSYSSFYSSNLLSYKEKLANWVDTKNFCIITLLPGQVSYNQLIDLDK